MSITVEISSYLRRFTDDKAAIEVEGITVGECLSHLGEHFPELKKAIFTDGRLQDFIGIYVNKEDAYPDELAKPVKDGDTIQVLLIIDGG